MDPALQLRHVIPLAEFYYQLRAFWRYIVWGLGLLTASVLLLSAAGILRAHVVHRRAANA